MSSIKDLINTEEFLNRNFWKYVVRFWIVKNFWNAIKSCEKYHLQVLAEDIVEI